MSASTTRRDLMANAIVDCATALFDERGFSETSLQDIADEIGIQRPSLYHYFDSKDEILLTLLDDVIRQNETADFEDAEDLTPSERLERMLFNYGRSIAEDPARFRLITRNEARLPPDVLARYQERRRHNWELLKSIIAEGIRAGTFRPLDVDLAASALHGSVTGMMFWFRPERGVADRVGIGVTRVDHMAGGADLAVKPVLFNLNLNARRISIDDDARAVEGLSCHGRM